MPNNLHSYHILLASSLGFFVGTFLARITNTIFQGRFEKTKFTYIWTKEAFFTSTAMGLLAGCGALAIGSVDRGYLESYSLLSIFAYAFFLSCFSGASDTWLKVIKLIFVKVLNFGNTQQP